jgi:hypothetical protein
VLAVHCCAFLSLVLYSFGSKSRDESRNKHFIEKGNKKGRGQKETKNECKV